MNTIEAVLLGIGIASAIIYLFNGDPKKVD